jgi:putative addiction module component (TIGR02574 family)
MGTSIDEQTLRKLSTDEKLSLIDTLWNSIEGEAALELTPDQLAEMQQRFEWAKANPDKCLSYEDFKARIRSLK